MDNDFKERMFDRQIAVMKGQAWNVVETLKQHDHGPLELTRRTRVCVWDDLVDVPVAIPMRAPSAEVKRKKVRIEQDEMDIGASASYSDPKSMSQSQDLLGSPTSELPNPNRFELTRDDSAADLGTVGEEGPVSPISINENRDYVDSHAREASSNLSGRSLPTRPVPRSKNRFSFDFSRNTPGKRHSAPGRQRSFSTRSGTRPAVYGGEDDIEGDLGYAAATDMEASKRQVIVERLETVKSRKPFFEWC